MRPSRSTAASISVTRLGLGARRDEMLEPVLHPLDRAAGDARGERGEHDVGKHRELDAEAAAAVGRDAQPQLRAGHAQRPRHHRMGAERALEVRHHVEAAVGGAVFGDDHVALHRGEGAARIKAGQPDAGVRLRKRARGIAVGEVADRDLVALRLRMQQRRRRRARGAGVDHRLERLVVDAHQLGGVLREVAALRHHQRHRLADIAHALDRQRPLVDRRLERDQERIGDRPHVLAGDHRPHPLARQRRFRLDAGDAGVRVRRADHVGMQRAGGHRQVVGIAPAPRQQRGILLANDRSAQKLRQMLTSSPRAADLRHRSKSRCREAGLPGGKLPTTFPAYCQ